MGQVLTLPNSFPSRYEILKVGGGELVQWAGMAGDVVFLPIGTVLRPLEGYAAGKYIYTVQPWGILLSSPDPNPPAGLTTYVPPGTTEPVPYVPPPVIAPPPPPVRITPTPPPPAPPIGPPPPQRIIPAGWSPGPPLPRPIAETILPPDGEAPADDGTPPPGSGLSAIPFWAWLAGGGVLLYLFTRGR